MEAAASSPPQPERTEPERDEFGYPLCPVCGVAIHPGESVAVRDRAMVHIACRRRRMASGPDGNSAHP
jgi:hypothetical protein